LAITGNLIVNNNLQKIAADCRRRRSGGAGVRLDSLPVYDPSHRFWEGIFDMFSNTRVHSKETNKSVSYDTKFIILRKLNLITFDSFHR